MSGKPNHPYHIVPLSPWPLVTSIGLGILGMGAALTLHSNFYGLPLLSGGVLLIVLALFKWWGSMIREGIEEKVHTEPVRNSFRIGMAFFIFSEVMFFFAFFWSFFNFSLDPVNLLDGVWATIKGTWPSAGIKPLDPWNLPLMNTLILLLSGTTVTWAHYSLEQNNQKDMVKALGITVLLGLLFTCLQAYEYHHAEFTIKDGIYPSNFYMATGFHGMHVIVGTIFLAVCYFRAKKGHFFNGQGHVGFEMAAWYWHFVDVVWLFLFIFVYIWGR